MRQEKLRPGASSALDQNPGGDDYEGAVTAIIPGEPDLRYAQPNVQPDIHDCATTTITATGTNGDGPTFPLDAPAVLVGKYLNLIGSFTKGLVHNNDGEIDLSDPEGKASWDSFVKALDDKDTDDFPNIKLGCGRKLVNPQAGLATDTQMPDPKTFKMLAPPTIESAEAAAEMVELYWMALLRDIPFSEYASSKHNYLIQIACDELSGLTHFTGPKIDGKVTPQTLFRGCSDGDNIGPYLSQFMLRDIPYGSLTIPQRQRTVLPGIDYMTTFENYLAVQNGSPNPPSDLFDPLRRYIRNERDLGEYVHIDALYEAYLNACLFLLRLPTADDAGNPYYTKPAYGCGSAVPPSQAATQVGFATFGGPHILSLVTEIATRALKAVWYQKWFVNLRLRPERYGALVHLIKTGKKTITDYPLHSQVLDSEAVKMVGKRFGSYLLPMQFPEGSPTHPAYGAGHATVAGACVTILKAWFDEKQLLRDVVVPNADGTELVSYLGDGALSLTVGGELNKVAGNIGIGRNMAGVHWRSDYTESLKLGEEVAVKVLLEQANDYNEDYSLTFTSFKRDAQGKPLVVTIRPGKNGQPGTAKLADGTDYPFL